MVSPAGLTRLEPHIGPARAALYLEACGQDADIALRLYEWNARLGAAFWVDLGHLEVAFRNAVDRRMVLRHQAKHRPGDWLDDPSGELGRDRFGPGRHDQPYLDIHLARRRVRSNNKADTHDQIVSEASFGLWHQLVSRSQRFLWPDVASAFPHAPDRRPESVSRPIARLRTLRNRIAHHHRIWPLQCRDRYQDLVMLAGYIDVDLAVWINSTSSVAGLLNTSPKP